MYRFLFVAVVLGLTVIAFWAFHGPGTPPVHSRTVAFDNVYGTVDRLPVQVKVDDGAEFSATATCDAMTCTFVIPLANARHELELSVIHNSQRSAPTRVAIDTSALP